jgi:hypothetical protein
MPLLDKYKSLVDEAQTTANASDIRAQEYALFLEIDRAMPRVLPQSPQTFSGTLLELHDTLQAIKAGQPNQGLDYFDDYLGGPCSQLQ